MAERPRLRHPKLAEVVADQLRQRILEDDSEELSLPVQESLLDEYGISKAGLREALRILETEGLITVRRGKVGGAVIHRPEARHAAYPLALVLQSRHVELDDVGRSLKRLEGMCAAMCAERPDRGEAVVPLLREANERARDNLDDELGYVAATAEFHDMLIECCGLATVKLVAGSVETLWLAHVQEWAEVTTSEDRFPSRAYRQEGIKAHERITTMIEKGQVTKAGRAAEEHVDPQQFYGSPLDARRRINVSTLTNSTRPIYRVGVSAGHDANQGKA